MLKHDAGFDSTTGIYNSLFQLDEKYTIPTTLNLDTASYVLSQFPKDLSRIALIDSETNLHISYAELHRSIRCLSMGLFHELGVRKGDVVFVLSPNSVLFPTICLAVFSLGAILTAANPLNTESEIIKQVHDSGAKIAISTPQEIHKLARSGIPTIIPTTSSSSSSRSVEAIIQCHDPIEWNLETISQHDTAAILYSSGTTGTSKGVVLTHRNFISIVTLLKWSVDATSSQNDIFLCFIPMFHIYGLAFFGLGLFCSGITTIVMERFDIQGMLHAIQSHRVNNLPAVPPVILGLTKLPGHVKYDLSSLRRVGSGAAPLSKTVANAFREKFPWVELRQGYGLTETCGATTFSLYGDQAKVRSGSCGMLVPTFSAKVVDAVTGVPLPPYKEGELWLKSPTIMRGYLGNEEATRATFSCDGWLKTGDLCYFDGDGFMYIVDRIKELIKHNGYQVIRNNCFSTL